MYVVILMASNRRYTWSRRAIIIAIEKSTASHSNVNVVTGGVAQHQTHRLHHEVHQRTMNHLWICTSIALVQGLPRGSIIEIALMRD